jgi:hypothetical protein
MLATATPDHARKLWLLGICLVSLYVLVGKRASSPVVYRANVGVVGLAEHILIRNSGSEPQGHLACGCKANRLIVVGAPQFREGCVESRACCDHRPWHRVGCRFDLSGAADDLNVGSDLDVASPSWAVVLKKERQLSLCSQCIWPFAWGDVDACQQHVGSLRQANGISLVNEGAVRGPASSDGYNNQEPIRPDRRLLAFIPIALVSVWGALYGVYALAGRTKLFGERLDLLFVLLVACGVCLVGLVAAAADWLSLGLG